MARNILAADPDLGQRVVDLQQCLLLGSLTPEQLYGLARQCQSRPIGLNEAGKPLSKLNDCMVFVVDGLFERVYLKDKEALNDSDKSVVLNELGLGEFWGEHYLVQQEAIEAWHIGLRAKAAGRLVLIKAKQFKELMTHWPMVQQFLLETTLKREFSQGLKLGAAQAQIQHSDFVIKRIESVADLLINQISGNKDELQIQNKYLLTEVPDLSGVSYKEQLIEQAYLPGNSQKEDRIRAKDNSAYTRTTKVGSGQTRQTYERAISAKEYTELLAKREGRRICKVRFVLSEPVNGATLTIDHFTGEGDLAGLCLLEVNFKDDAASQQFKMPPWLQALVDKDVTEDQQYSNRYFAQQG